jgi:hypothetical protein
MLQKICIPLLIVFIILTGFYTSGENDKIKNELKDPAQRHLIMNQIMSNSEYMSEFMNFVMENNKAKNIMMDQMFLMADNDSAITANMFQHMKEYNNIMNHMIDMMKGNYNSMHSYGLMHRMN